MVMYFNPIKVLMPLALWLLSAGRGQGRRRRHPLRLRGSRPTRVLLFISGLIIASLALLADLIVRSRGDT